MLAQVTQPAQDMLLGDTSTLELVGWCAAGLLTCLLGYLLFRLELAVLAGIAGAALAAAAVTTFRASPTSVDYAIACTCAAVLLALLSWLLYRAAFGLGTGLAVALGIATAFGARPPAHAWVLGVLAGSVACVLCFLWLKRLVMVVYGVSGAAVAAFSAGAIMTGSAEGLLDLLSDGDLLVIIALVAALIGLSVLGVSVQSALSNVFHSQLTPPENRSGPKRSKQRHTGGRVPLRPGSRR